MTNVKTAVSIEEPLFARAEELARQLDVSRSKLYEMALEDYLHRQESARILQELNDVVSEVDDAGAAEEVRLRAETRRHHRRLVEGEW